MVESRTKDGEPAGRLLIGTSVGRYRIEAFLGRGGAGEVYLANDPLLRRHVALKRIGRGHGAEERRHVLREARRASRISDPGIAAIHDVIEREDEVVLVLEYVEGQTLAAFLAGRPSLDRFWPIAEECARALAVAHEHGVLHRDIKPTNIMITGSGSAKILDFGLARHLHRDRSPDAEPSVDSSTTESLRDVRVAGTPGYISPESLLGAETDERADIFSLGVTFYEFLARRRPFSGPTIPAVIQSTLHDRPEAPTVTNPEVSPSLSDLVMRMLAKDPEERPRSAEEVLRALQGARGETAAVFGGGGSATRDPVLALGGAHGSGAADRRPRLRILLPAGFALLAGTALAAAVITGRLTVLRERLGWTVLPANAHLAVLPGGIEGPSDENLSAVSLGISSLLSAALARLSVSPPLQVASFMDLVQTDVTEASQARELKGANLVLRPVLRRGKRDLEETLHLVDPATGREIGSRTLRAPRSRPYDLVRGAYLEAAALLRLKGAERGLSGLPLTGTEGAGTVQFYLEGLGRATEVDRGAAEPAPVDTSRIRKALIAFERAASSEPDHAPSLSGIARVCRQMSKATGDTVWRARGEEAARRALSLDPGLADAHKRLAFLLWDRGDREGATGEMERAASLEPTDDVALANLGSFYGARGREKEEERVYQEAARATPHRWFPWWRLAVNCYYPHGRIEEARDAFERVVRLAPDFYLGYQSLGGIEVLRGDYREAARDLEKSISLHPNAEALGNLGVAYFNLRDLDRSASTFNEVFQYKSAEYEDWLNLGDAWYAIPERREKAASAYAEAIRLGREKLRRDPSDALVRGNLAQIFSRLGARDSAEAYLGRALSLDPRNPMVHYCAALTDWQLGEREKALAWMEKAVAGGYPVAWLRDSPMLDEWRTEDRFRKLVEAAPGRTGADPSPRP